MSKTRIAVALGLALIVGSVAQLPHAHAAADSTLHAAHAAQILDAATGSEDDVICPVCVLQRLLSQAEAAGVNPLEKPAAVGVVCLAPTPGGGERVAWSGSPRGPPPIA